jgi:hypothetical protein
LDIILVSDVINLKFKTMFKGVAAFYIICLGLCAILVICEIIISSLGERNKIRRWWRKNIIAEYKE